MIRIMCVEAIGSIDGDVLLLFVWSVEHVEMCSRTCG
jgi:hypothetical protein